MFVPGGQVIGAGILIGAAVSAGTGLATGTFDPRQVALGGVVGGIGAGVGVAFTSTTAAVVSGGAIGAGNDLASQVISGRPIDWRSVAVNGGVGAATGGIGAGTASYTSTMTRSVVVGAATDGGGDIVTQALTGDGSINWGQVAVSTTGGGIDSAVTHHLESSSHALTPEPQQLALTAAPERLALPAGPTPETVTVYRGTHLTAEIDFQQQTGTMMSEAARQAFAGTGDVDIANSYSASAHQRAVEIWGSERDYVQAHGAFGREIVDVSGDRTMVSVTTDRSIAEGFAKESGGVVFRGEVPADSLLAQTLDGAGESEYLAPHWIPMVPDVP